jgi:hypothetical protein
MAKTGYVWDGTQFVSISSPIAAVPNAVVIYDSVAPTSPRTGQLWINSSTRILYVYSGSAWIISAGGPINLNSNIISEDYIVEVGYNGESAGPVTISLNKNVMININSTWSII